MKNSQDAIIYLAEEGYQIEIEKKGGMYRVILSDESSIRYVEKNKSICQALFNLSDRVLDNKIKQRPPFV